MLMAGLNTKDHVGGKGEGGYDHRKDTKESGHSLRDYPKGKLGKLLEVLVESLR